MSLQLPTFIAKVLNTICLIWATSKHYNTPSRVIVILQEFCNQIDHGHGSRPPRPRRAHRPRPARGCWALGAPELS